MSTFRLIKLAGGWALLRSGGQGVLLWVSCKRLGKGKELPELEVLDAELNWCLLQDRFFNGVNETFLYMYEMSFIYMKRSNNALYIWPLSKLYS